MAIHYEVHDTAEVVVIRIEGPVDDGKILSFLADLAAEWSHRPGMDVLIDFRRVRRGRVTGEGVRALASLAIHLDERLCWRKVALVAKADPSYGLCRMFQMLLDQAPAQVEVFRYAVDAWDWINPNHGKAPTLVAPTEGAELRGVGMGPVDMGKGRF